MCEIGIIPLAKSRPAIKLVRLVGLAKVILGGSTSLAARGIKFSVSQLLVMCYTTCAISMFH